MPLYEYKCQSCGEQFEVRRNIEEDTGEEKCPRCKSSDTRKVFSLFSNSTQGNSYQPAPSRFRFG